MRRSAANIAFSLMGRSMSWDNLLIMKHIEMEDFKRYIGIDYSGAKTPTSSLKGLRVYVADGVSQPVEIQPPLSPRKYWTRGGVAEWLVKRLNEDPPTLIGIDHGLSFPLRFFDAHGLKHDWPAFLEDFQHHWPTDENHTRVDHVRIGKSDCGAAVFALFRL